MKNVRQQLAEAEAAGMPRRTDYFREWLARLTGDRYLP